jgi:hypothetical protein
VVTCAAVYNIDPFSAVCICLVRQNAFHDQPSSHFPKHITIQQPSPVKINTAQVIHSSHSIHQIACQLQEIFMCGAHSLPPLFAEALFQNVITTISNQVKRSSRGLTKNGDEELEKTSISHPFCDTMPECLPAVYKMRWRHIAHVAKRAAIGDYRHVQ